MAISWQRRREAMLVWFRVDRNFVRTSEITGYSYNSLKNWSIKDNWGDFADTATKIAIQELAVQAGKEKASFAKRLKIIIEDGLRNIDSRDLKFSDIPALIKLYFELIDKPLGRDETDDQSIRSIEQVWSIINAEIQTADARNGTGDDRSRAREISDAQYSIEDDASS